MDLFGGGDPFELLGRLAHLFDSLPPAARVLAAGHQAAFARCQRCNTTGWLIDTETGQPVPCGCVDRRAAAVEYLRTEGWREAMDVIRPGVGTAVRDSIAKARAAATETHAIVGGHVVLDGFVTRPKPPWSDFQRALRGMEWASIPIFGRRGGGKTQTALRLAEVATLAHHYPVEAVNMWGHDLPSWVQPVTADLMVNRLQIVRRALDQPEREYVDAEQGADGVYVAPARRPKPRTAQQERAAAAAAEAVERIKRRVIIIDENSLMDPSPQSPERRAVVGAMTQARHLEWIVIYVGQLMNQLPKSVLTSDLIMIKEPAGDEDSFDRDDQGARYLWQRAAQEFDQIRGDRTWWRPPYDVPEAWVYVKARYPVLYGGMMPIRLPETP